ncbi:MAG TPA: DUF1326 domain-containing protein, partial [Terriglobia bacterium]|nr:DUF1326 domain-containing protein [Terriglobia bacterium]
DWKLKGEGIVCCPCAVPCPCRSNAAPSYGHCEATLYLRIKEGRYGSVDLRGMQLVDSGGMCAVHYQKLSALYFDRSASPAQQAAFMKLLASFSRKQSAEFPHLRVVHIDAHITGGHLFTVTIPGILEIVVDRNWGQPSPPMPMVAAPDHFSNLLQYVQNIRYHIQDDAAGLNFNYSRRQANFREVDLTAQQYRDHSMLIQFGDGKGWFTPQQMEIIQAQRLKIPDLAAIRKEALRLRTGKAVDARR